MKAAVNGVHSFSFKVNISQHIVPNTFLIYRKWHFKMFNCTHKTEGEISFAKCSDSPPTQTIQINKQVYT